MRLRSSLLVEILPILERAMTAQGHLKPVVPWEHRGNCLPPSKGCTPECLNAQRVVDELRAYLQTTRPAVSPAAGRAALRAFSPPTRRARAVPGRSLPSAPAGRRAAQRKVG